MSGYLDRLAEQAQERARAGLKRTLVPRGSGDQHVDLAGNDYLGLARHPAVVSAAMETLSGYGLGATASRLVVGTTDVHAALEDALASFLGTETAIVYSSGYLANLGAVRALATPRGLVVSDAYNHASLVDGCRLAARAGSEVVVAPHASPEAVAEILAAYPGRPAVVVTESVFSVDGDLAPLGDLLDVARSYGAVLLVDDAHGVGLLGPAGSGGVGAAGLTGAPDVVVTATLSKAFGASGGVVAGPALLRTHLVDTSRSFIFDTALPPAVAAGALAALGVLRAGDDLRAEFTRRRELVVRRLRDAGLHCGQPAGGVISVTAPGPDEALAWAAACRERGVAVGCFRPPSTPDGRSRLRLTLSLAVPAGDFEKALDVILECRP